MAGLSSNVMNMKFMQKAHNKTEEQKKETQIKKVKDSSEWILPNRSIVQQKIKPLVLVQTVGYGSIANIMVKKNIKDEEEEKMAKTHDESPKPPLKVCTELKRNNSALLTIRIQRKKPRSF